MLHALLDDSSSLISDDTNDEMIYIDMPLCQPIPMSPPKEYVSPQ